MDWVGKQAVSREGGAPSQQVRASWLNNALVWLELLVGVQLFNWVGARVELEAIWTLAAPSCVFSSEHLNFPAIYLVCC